MDWRYTSFRSLDRIVGDYTLPSGVAERELPCSRGIGFLLPSTVLVEGLVTSAALLIWMRWVGATSLARLLEVVHAFGLAKVASLFHKVSGVFLEALITLSSPRTLR